MPVGILLGLIAALRRNSWVDNLISVGSLAFIGLPEFVSGLILISIFAIQLGWLPAQSAIAPDAGFIEAFPYLVLPAITVALTSLAYVVRMTRSSTVDVLQMDYVRTANLKGLPPRQGALHARAAQLAAATITVVAIGIGWLIGGLIVTEAVFSYPGHRPPAAVRHPAPRPAADPGDGAADRHHLRRRQPGRRHPVRGAQSAHPLHLSRCEDELTVLGAA